MLHASRFRLVPPRLKLLLLVLLAGLVALITPIARAASGTVILEIAQAEAINKNNDSFPLAFWAIQQDFYPKLTVAGGPVAQGPELAQRDWALWDPVFATSKTFADLNELNDNNIVSGTVELWDADDIDSHDQFDINADPITPNRALRLLLDVCSLRFARQGDTSGAQFSGPTWMPQGNESDPGRVQVNIRTSDGRSLLPNNVAITAAGPVQAVYHPRFIIENKATAFKLDLSSSHTVPVNAAIVVQMSDGFTTVNDVKSVMVPPEGLRVFFFDGTGSAPPYSPRKQPNLRRLQYAVTMSVAADSTEADKSGPFPNCIPSADNALTGSVPMITTNSPTTLYLPWDWGSSAIIGETITPAPPTVAQVRTTAEANEKFRRAIFPIADVVSAVFPGRALSVKTELEPGPTILGWSVAAHIAGIDTLELMPHNGWFSANASRLRFGATAIGMSLGEFAPHAVISEQGFSEVAVHEQGHTFQLSRRTCSTGGAAELLFGLGCRDEYNHATADGAPYETSGFDVLGQVYPSGSGGAAGTRDIQGVINFMDTTGPRDGDPYDRWIDNLSYDWLSERLRSPQDPALISISGYVQVPGGLDQPTGGAVAGVLLPSFRYDGVPDIAEAALNDQQGPSEGQFFVRLVTGQGNRIYRFTPQFKLEGSDTNGYGFFAFAIPWDPATTRIELVGPGKSTDIGNPNGATGILIGLNVSSSAPTLTKLRAAAGKAPDLGNAPFTPPTIKAGEQIVVAWDQQDADPGTNLVAMLYVLPPQGPGGLSNVATAIPLGVNLVGGQASFSANQFADLPGDYGARVVVSDGVNTTSLEVAKLFSVRTGVFVPLTRR